MGTKQHKSMTEEPKKQEPQQVQKSFELAEKKARVFSLSPNVDEKPLPPPSTPIEIKKNQNEQK